MSSPHVTSFNEYRDQQMLIGQLCFPVETTPVQAIMQMDSGAVLTVPTTKHQAVVRTDTNEVVSVMSDRYQLVSNSDVIGALVDALSHSGQAYVVKKAELYNQARRFHLELTFPDISFTPESDGEPMIYRMIVGGSYDGTKRVWFQMGAFRQVCSNGMIAGTIDYSITRRHVGSRAAEIPNVIRERIPQVVHRAADEMKEALAPIWQQDYFMMSSRADRLLTRLRSARFAEDQDTKESLQKEVTGELIPFLPRAVQQEMAEALMMQIPTDAEGPVATPRHLYNLGTHYISRYKHGNLTEATRIKMLGEWHKLVATSLVG